MVSEIRIEKLKTKKDLKKFIKFPWKIYKDDPNWVPPLIMDLKHKLNPGKNPFFHHARMDLFLAYKGDEITGRIAAIIDENHNKTHNEKIVFFGFYESIDDVNTAKALLDTAAGWGKDQGMEVLRGPMNPSMNDECAFLLEGFDSPPVIMMTYNPKYYLDLMEKCGLVKAKDLYAFFMTKDHEVMERVDQIVKKVKDEISVTLRPFNLKKIEEEAEKVKYVYNHGWEKNWGFVPWTEEEMDDMARSLKSLADPDLIILAEYEGRPVGFALGLPNYNEVLIKLNGRITPWAFLKFLYYKRRIKGMRAIVFGVLKEFRASGLSYLLYNELDKNAINKGYEWGETSWQLEDNEAINRFVASVGGKVYKKYRIYEKPVV